MAFIEILDGNFPKQTALCVSDCMTVKTPENGRRSYWMKEAIVSIEETFRDKKGVSFDLQLRDGNVISCKTTETVFKELKGFAKESSYLNYITENKSAEDIKKSKKKLIVSLVAGGLVLWVIGGFLLGLGEEKERTVEDEKLNATIRCQMLVQNYLKSPSTAKFPADYTKHVTVIDDVHFNIESYVDSQNSYGATIRTPFTCKLMYTGGGQKGWELVEFDIHQ